MLIVDRLGMDYKSFFISVFARQKDLNALSTLRPADRKKTILRMLEIDVLDDVVIEIDKDAKGKRTELANLNLLLFEANGQEKRKNVETERSILETEVQQLESSLQEQRKLLEALDKRTNAVKGEWDQAETKYQGILIPPAQSGGIAGGNGKELASDRPPGQRDRIAPGERQPGGRARRNEPAILEIGGAEGLDGIGPVILHGA